MCDANRVSFIVAGSLVQSAPSGSARTHKNKAAATWKPEGPHRWWSADPVDPLAIAVGWQPRDAPGGHVNAALLLLPSRVIVCAQASKLERLA